MSLAVATAIGFGLFPASDAREVEGWLDALAQAILSKDFMAAAVSAVPVFTYVKARWALKAQHAAVAPAIAAAAAQVVPAAVAPAPPAAPAPAPTPAADPFKV